MTVFSVIICLVLSLAPVQQQDYAAYTIPASSEGDEIPVRLYSPAFSGAPMIVVVHDWGESMDNWNSIARSFRELGYSVLLFALPDHEPGNLSHYLHTNRRIRYYLTRVQTVYEYARSRTGVVHLLGSGLGANLAILAAGDFEVQGRIVAVSPGLTLRDLVLEPQSILDIKEKLFLVASQEDTYAAYSIRTIAAMMESLPEEERSPTVLYSNSGHGVWLLKRLPEAVSSITRWFSEFRQ
jgi:dienelactone hydrolase